jgi:putative nucleotidyltransferase with HDIG domain
MPALPTRDDAWNLLCEYTQNENLRKHALAVEACVSAYARKTGADEQLWRLTALLHDFDYERWPNDAHSPTEEHPAGGSAILRERGYPTRTTAASRARLHSNTRCLPATNSPASSPPAR